MVKEFSVRIEISKGTNVKYEFDHINNNLICDRILHTPFSYFFNYGYIENTLGGDGDPVDAIVLCEESLFPTCLIRCRPIGLLSTIDNEGQDDKIIMVPVNRVDPAYKDITEITQLNENLLEKIKFFFENYKKLEKDKWVKIDNWKNSEEAYKIIEKGLIDKKIEKVERLEKIEDVKKEYNLDEVEQVEKIEEEEEIIIPDSVVIILRHVTNEFTDKYWKLSYDSVRKNYGNDIKIVIIDDNSSYNPTYHKLENCKIIYTSGTGYEGRGELLPYYYMYKLKLGKKALIIHDSVFLNIFLDFKYVDKYAYLWDFIPNIDDDENIERILSKIENNSYFLQYYRNKNWKGCFGGMSIISLEVIEQIVEKIPNFFDILLEIIQNRRDRMAFERIISIILNCVTNIVITNSIFGNIHNWCEKITNGKKTCDLKLEDYNSEFKYEVIKLWTGR
jgi:inorganic pyrophosphatase